MIQRQYEQKQLSARQTLEDHKRHVRETISGYSELEDMICEVSVSQGRKLLEGDSNALTELHDKLQELRKKQIELLNEANLPKDYLEMHYECPDCKDTGYVDGKKCHCLIQEINAIAYAQSQIYELMQNDNFDTLSYSYYQGDDLSRFQKAVISCKNFVKKFNSDYHNLFFYGTVGTGKSFLSGCVAKALLDQNHSVLYFSSAALFDAVADQTFGRSDDDSDIDYSHDIYNVDLLIIDDLGTEITNQFVASCLFNCLTRRQLNRKATIISTNLSLEELRDRYSDRIFSRITSNFDIIKITGPDIRMYKKRQMNSGSSQTTE